MTLIFRQQFQALRGGRIAGAARAKIAGALRDFETGTGFAYAKLSGSQKPGPPVANAPVVRMTQRRAIGGDKSLSYKGLVEEEEVLVCYA